jgi:hypothetical protein
MYANMRFHVSGGVVYIELKSSHRLMLIVDVKVLVEVKRDRRRCKLVFGAKFRRSCGIATRFWD